MFNPFKAMSPMAGAIRGLMPTSGSPLSKVGQMQQQGKGGLIQQLMGGMMPPQGAAAAPMTANGSMTDRGPYGMPTSQLPFQTQTPAQSDVINKLQQNAALATSSGRGIGYSGAGMTNPNNSILAALMNRNA